MTRRPASPMSRPASGQLSLCLKRREARFRRPLPGWLGKMLHHGAPLLVFLLVPSLLLAPVGADKVRNASRSPRAGCAAPARPVLLAAEHDRRAAPPAN